MSDTEKQQPDVFSNLTKYSQRNFVPNEINLTCADEVSNIFEQLLERDVDSSENFEALILDRSELSAAIGEVRSRLYISMTCQTDDAQRAEAYQKFTTEIMPIIADYSHKLDEKFVSTISKFPLDADRYLVYSRSKKNDIEIFRQENIALSTKESLLSQEYQKITGAMTAKFDGEEKTLTQIAVHTHKPDRELREKAWRTIANRRLEDSEKIEEVFDRMLTLRNQIASNAGLDNYRDYMFKAYGRFDYTPDDCKRFHETVAEVVMPIMEQIYSNRKTKMNLTNLRPWDTKVDPLGREPLKPFEKTEKLIDGCENIFNKLDPQLGKEFSQMKELGLLDLANRKGKAPGGYQSTLSETRKPFIFMNAVGVNQDMRTLLHEGGHAFHAFAAADEKIADYRHAPMEFCEVASMSMELLAEPYITEFYSKSDAQRSTQEQLEQVVDILPWVATIDKFQHWIYENPANNGKTRAEAFSKIYDEFGGNFIDYGGLENEKGRLWHRQLHIFQVPFYYIEYAIAQLGALQIWLNAKTDKNKALNDYKNALALGGSKPLPKLFEAANIKFDFSKETIKPLMDAVGEELAKF